MRKFRRDHHLSIQSTYEKGQWVVGSFGRIENEEFPSTGFDLGIQYSFHIQLESKFGYYLGTLAGYFIELEKRGQRDFGPSSMWKLPGLLGGLVYNYSATGRVSVGAAGYLSRIVKLSAKGLAGEDEEISVTGETFDYFVSWERFVSLNSAIKIQYVNHRLWVPPARDAERFALDARIKRFSQGVSLGATYHFL
ncbi:MAG: hypothetical protein NT027_03345 [Proteobacteria bacterium]|nr:hypothetical protein [Pseudomonadota bacterium]